jgi:hypothetical protein
MKTHPAEAQVWTSSGEYRCLSSVHDYAEVLDMPDVTHEWATEKRHQYSFRCSYLRESRMNPNE